MATATSTSTLIQAVNTVLQAIGERRVTSLSSRIAAMTAQVIQNVVYELSTIHDWSFSRDKIPATSWLLDSATLTDIVRIHGVSTGDTTLGFTQASFIQKDVYDAQNIQNYSSTTAPYGYPLWWTVSSFNTVKVNPYPTDSTSQAKVLFDVTRTLIPPTVATGVFPIPEQYMPIVYYRAAAIMALQHLADTETEAQFIALFERFAQRIRERDGQKAASGMTMHRRGRGRYYG